MAVQKKPVRKTPARQTKKQAPAKAPPIAVVFWLVFFAVIAGIFLVKRETIGRNLALLLRRNPAVESPAVREEDPPPEIQTEPVDVSGESGGTTPPVTAPERQPPAAEPLEQPAVTPEEKETPSQSPGNQPAERPAAPSVPAAPATPPATETPKPPPVIKPAEIRERNIYFTQVGADGSIFRSKVTRAITVSDSPMRDCLNSLLAGPTSEENGRGIMTLIPQNTRILSIQVRGTTAYINFSEDFQYNTYGIEGYAAQLRQIVWTATEFPTVKDVQILIEGRRVEYLGEGIYIGIPISRGSL